MGNKLDKIKDGLKKAIGKGGEGKKRGQYKKQECPYCHVHVGNLANHIRMKHQAEREEGEEHPAREPTELTKDDLLGGKARKEPEEKTVYYCTACHAELRKGETPCWNCGEAMVWEGLE